MFCINKKLPVLLAQGRVKLIVIDSIAALFRCEFNIHETAKRAKQLSALAAQLNNLNCQYNAPVICVNQVHRYDNIFPRQRVLAWSAHLFHAFLYTLSVVISFAVFVICNMFPISKLTFISWIFVELGQTESFHLIKSIRVFSPNTDRFFFNVNPTKFTCVYVTCYFVYCNTPSPHNLLCFVNITPFLYTLITYPPPH